MSFSKRAIIAAALCQDKDPSGLHADHIIPKSKGGTDDVTNCQLLMPTVNIKKGASQIVLRHWQKDFLEQWDEHMGTNFLCVVIPGGGKTIAALSAAERFIRAGNDRKLMVVVPSVNLTDQWQQEAVKFGLHLQTRDLALGGIKDDFQGCVVRYQGLATMSLFLRKMCAAAPTLVILDEPHHCAENKDWGENAKEAFGFAKRRLLLSGTPFRTDGAAIPFIDYSDEVKAGVRFCHPDFRYDYPQARKDRVVRHLRFGFDKGDFTLLTDIGAEVHTIDSETDDEEAARGLRHLLNPDGNFVRDLIRRSAEQLSKIRAVIPDAAAMAVCMDMEHAQRIADRIKDVTGIKPCIVVSDEDKATGTVSHFRNSSDPWLVSVKQVAEGTDIKRLQVLCYLTNGTTELFFRQLVGRVSRIRFNESSKPNEETLDMDDTGYVFLPAVPRLKEHCRNIESAQLQAIMEEVEETYNPSSAQQERTRSTNIFAGSTNLGVDSVFFGNKESSPFDAECISTIVNIGGTSEEKAKAVYDELRRQGWGAPRQPSSPPPPPEKPLEIEMNDLRRVCWGLANSLARLLNCEAKDVHKKFKPQMAMSLDELKAKKERLHQCILARQMP